MFELDLETQNEILEQDGSLRDIYAFETDVAIWKRLVDGLVASAYPCAFQIGGVPTTDSRRLDRVFDPTTETRGSLHVEVASGDIAAHFFWSGEVELDLDPRQWSLDTLSALFEFLIVVGDLTQRNIYLTLEGAPDQALVAWLHEKQVLVPLRRPVQSTATGIRLARQLRTLLEPLAEGAHDIPTAEITRVSRAIAALYQPNALW